MLLNSGWCIYRIMGYRQAGSLASRFRNTDIFGRYIHTGRYLRQKQKMWCGKQRHVYDMGSQGVGDIKAYKEVFTIKTNMKVWQI